VFEAERSEADVMQRPPRDPREPLFTRAMLQDSLLLGAAAFVAVAVVYGTSLTMMSADQARAAGFITLVVTNLLLILVHRSHKESLVSIVVRPNRAFWGITTVALFALLLETHAPGVASIFRFDSPSPAGIAASIAAAFLAVTWIEGLRSARRRRAAGAGTEGSQH
jgi:Ca2+-transporting ATPase